MKFIYQTSDGKIYTCEIKEREEYLEFIDWLETSSIIVWWK